MSSLPGLTRQAIPRRPSRAPTRTEWMPGSSPGMTTRRGEPRPSVPHPVCTGSTARPQAATVMSSLPGMTRQPIPERPRRSLRETEWMPGSSPGMTTKRGEPRPSVPHPVCTGSTVRPQAATVMSSLPGLTTGRGEPRPSVPHPVCTGSTARPQATTVMSSLPGLTRQPIP
jgi:hypothetical protein